MFRILLVLIALFTTLSPVFSPAAFALEAAELKVKLPTDKVHGKDGAKVTIIEYASLSCPHCAHFYTSILPDLEKDYIDTGKVQFIFRDFPLNEPGLMGAQLAHCAAQNGGDDRYFAALKAMFSTQADWAFAEDFKDRLLAVGKALSLEEKSLKACMEDKEIQTNILTSRQEASEKLGVDSTPYFFINGEKARITSLESIKKAVDDALKGITPAEAAKETAKSLTVAGKDDLVLGKESAKVTLVEYINLACPHCGAFHTKLLDALRKDYIDTGKVKVVFRDFPMNHPAFYAYMVAHCVPKEKFFDTVDLLIADTAAWAGATAFLQPLQEVAKKAGLDREAFYACLENKEIEADILKTLKGAEALELQHSPAVYVNGTAMAKPDDVAAILAAIDVALKSK